MDCINETMLINSDITCETILPCVAELFVDERMDRCLVVNPLGPWWFIGEKLHADYVQLCDGKRTLVEIQNELSELGYGKLTDERMVAIAQSLQKAKIFDKTEKVSIEPASVVFFNVTKRCNLRCPYCYYDSVPAQYEEGGEELDADEWIDFAGKIAKVNPNAKIIFSGGEPLIRSDIIRMIESVSDRYNLTTKLITNGTLFSDSIVTRLSKLNNFSIQVSIDSNRPKINEQTRGKGSLEKSLELARQLKAAGISFDISSTITKINLSAIREFKQFCQQKKYGYRSSIFTLSGDLSKENRDRLELSPEEYLDASTYALEDFDPDTTMGHPMIPGQRRYGCGMGYGQIDISPDGSVYPCSHLIEPRFYIGNIRTDNLNRLIDEGYRLYGSCDVDNDAYCTSGKCPFRYCCGGGCRAATYNNYGTMDTKPKNCEQLKQGYINALWVSMLGPAYMKNSEKDAAL